MKAKINEIFSSIQGEGPVVGYKQLFIRFCRCNLKCSYCDTEFLEGENFTPDELFQKITNEYDLKTFHSVSLTGGEPLLHADFLKEFLPLIKDQTKIYADIKLGMNTFEKHEEFFKNCENIYTFAKIVFDEKITEEEIQTCCKIGAEHNIELVLQPKMDTNNKMCVTSEFCNEILDKFTSIYHNVRLIPQVHKFLDVR